MNNDPYQAYKQQSFMTMTQGDMLIAVYDAIVKELNFVKTGLAGSDFGEVNSHCQKAQVLLKHLQSTLDFKFEVSNGLNELYEYFIRAIIQINIKKSPDSLDDIMGMVYELRETYMQADRLNRSAEAVSEGV